MDALERKLSYDPGVPRYRDEQWLAAFGQAVRFARVRRGMTIAELAASAQPPIERALLGRLELGRRDPGLMLIVRIAAALRTTPARLIESAEQELRRIEAGEGAQVRRRDAEER